MTYTAADSPTMRIGLSPLRSDSPTGRWRRPDSLYADQAPRAREGWAYGDMPDGA